MMLTDVILFRATIAEAEYIEKEIEQPGNGAGGAYRPPPRTKEIQVKLEDYENIFFSEFSTSFPIHVPKSLRGRQVCTFELFLM